MTGQNLVMSVQAIIIKNIIRTFFCILDISFCGMILEDANTLTSYGINPGDILHILENLSRKDPEVKKLVTDSDMVTAFRRLTILSGYRHALSVRLIK